MKTMKVRSHEVVHLTGSERDGFMCVFYELESSCVGTVRTVHGRESHPFIVRVQVPVVMMPAEKQAEVDEEWCDGLKVEVVEGIYQGYVGYLRVKLR